MRFTNPILNKVFLLLFLTGVLLTILLTTDPNKMPLVLIIVPFLLAGLVLYHLTKLLLLHKRGKSKSFSYNILPLSVAFLGVCLLLLSSLHQLTWKDTLLVAVFTVMLWIYLSRADFL